MRLGPPDMPIPGDCVYPADSKREFGRYARAQKERRLFLFPHAIAAKRQVQKLTHVKNVFDMVAAFAPFHSRHSCKAYARGPANLAPRYSFLLHD